MQTVKLTEALPETITTQFDFAATYDNVTYTIFNSAFFVNEIWQHFSDRFVSLSGDDLSAALVSLFGIWKSSRSETYARRMYALAINYDPLENYNRTETREGVSETTHGETITRTHNNTDTKTYSGTETETSDLYGVNSQTGVPADVNTKSFTQRQDTDAHTGTIADAHTGKDSTEDGYELHAFGNIGVTTSQQMLESDIALLKHDIALTAVCDFIDRYTWFVDGLSL